MIRSYLRALMLVSFFFACAGSADVSQAVPLTIVNPSFESPALVLPTVSSTTATGWTNLGPNSSGVWKTSGSPSYWSSSPPDGTQVGFVSLIGTATPTALTQTLASVLVDQTMYTLSGFVAHPIGYGSTLGTTYSVQLWSGANLLATGSGTAAEGTWSPFSVTYNSTGSPYLGGALQIRLGSSRDQSDFDMISLDATSLIPAPEPSSCLLLSLLLGPCAVIRRKGQRGKPEDRAQSTEWEILTAYDRGLWTQYNVAG